MKIKNLLHTIFISILAFQLNAQIPKVHSTGAMKDMGSTYDLHIFLDTISPKSHLYGMGPYDRMKGEITVVDGKPYFASAFVDGEYKVGTDWNIRSPFFVYSDVKEWSVFKMVLLTVLKTFKLPWQESPKKMGMTSNNPSLLRSKALLMIS